MVGYPLVAAAGATLLGGLQWCLLGVSRGGTWPAGCGRLWEYRIHGGNTVCWRAAVGGAVGCGGGLVSVSSVLFAAVRHVLSSAGPLGGLLWRCVEGGLKLRRVQHMLGRDGWGGGARACWPALRPSLFSVVVSPACLPPAPLPVSSSVFPVPLSFCVLVVFLFFFFRGVCVCGWGTAFAALGVGVGSTPMLVLVWAWVPWWMVDGGLLRSGFPVCVWVLLLGVLLVVCQLVVLLVLPVWRVLLVMLWVVVSSVVLMVRVTQAMHRAMAPPFLSIVRVLHGGMVRLVCAAGGATGGGGAIAGMLRAMQR